MSSPIPFVIIEHDADHGKRLFRLLELLVPTCLYSSCQDEEARLRAQSSRGLIAPASCLASLGRSRKTRLAVPVLSIAEPQESHELERHSSGIRPAVAEPSVHYERQAPSTTWPMLVSRRPVRPEILFAFIRMALGDQDEGRFRLICVLESYARRRSLSARQIELSVMAALGADRTYMLDVLNISPNTLKSEIRHLLRKCDASSLDDLGRALLRESLLGRDELGTRDATPAMLARQVGERSAE